MFGPGGIGIQEIVVIALLVLVLFGAKNIPQVMRSFGEGVREMKRGIKSIEEDVDE